MIDAKPCPRCFALYEQGKIRGETVMPLPEGARAPRAIYGDYKGPCCHDCQAADNCIKLGYVHKDFVAARVVIGNERQEMLRISYNNGASQVRRLMRPAPLVMQFDQHHDWLEANYIEGGTLDITQSWAYWAEQFPEAGPSWDAFAADHKIDREHRIKLEIWRVNHAVGLGLQLVDEYDCPFAQYLYSLRSLYTATLENLTVTWDCNHGEPRTAWVWTKEA